MENIDLSKFNLGELKELSKKISEQMSVAEQQDVERAAEQIETLARSLNMTAQELIERTGLLKAKQKRGPKPGVKGPALYQNKNDSTKTWTGKGRQPGWVTEHLGGGGQLDELKIAA